MACQSNRGNNLKMPTTPKSVQCKGQFLTAPCRVVSAFVTGSPMHNPLTINICDDVTAQNPREPAAPAVLSAFTYSVVYSAFLVHCSHSLANHYSAHCVFQGYSLDPALLADFRVIQADSKRFKPKKRKNSTP